MSKQTLVYFSSAVIFFSAGALCLWAAGMAPSCNPLALGLLLCFSVYTLGPPKWLPMYLVLEAGSILVGLFSLLSFFLWKPDAPLYLNPFAALLTLVATPFFFAMGRVSRRELKTPKTPE